MKNVHIKILGSNNRLDGETISKYVSDEGFSVKLIDLQKISELTDSKQHTVVIIINQFIEKEFATAKIEITNYLRKQGAVSQCDIVCGVITNSAETSLRTRFEIDKVVQPSRWNEEGVAQRIIAALYGGVGVCFDKLILPEFEGEDLSLKCPIRHGSGTSLINLIGASKKMRNLFHEIKANYSATCESVLIRGETGTGKELIATVIHTPDGIEKEMDNFFDINIAEIEPSLLTSELFGHKKGAFTGAIETVEGLLETAENGTVFLDEIGDLPPHIQVKLLRVLNNRRFKKVGEHKVATTFNGRLIFATHRDLEEMGDKFREDFYYRIAGETIKLPSLCDRKVELELLAKEFYRVWKENLREKRNSDAENPANILQLDQKAFDKIVDTIISHSFPGNVRRYYSILMSCFNDSKSKPEFNVQKLKDEIERDNERLRKRNNSGLTDLISQEFLTYRYEEFKLKISKEYFTQIYLNSKSLQEEMDKTGIKSKSTLYEYLSKEDRALIKKSRE